MIALEARSLGRRFGRRTAIEGVTFEVGAGHVFGLLGPNGSGKTTTLACALGLLDPTSGEARVLGLPSRRIHATRGRVGVVFDGPGLLDGLTARQNLEYARRLLGHAGGRSPDEALRLVGARELADRRPSRLSLGERKRIAVARALLGAPELVVLDEPLSALDTTGVAAMLELIRELARRGTTLVVSSHRLHEMESIVSHAAILSRGRCIAQGSLEELLGGDGERLRVEVQPLGEALRVCRGLPGVRIDRAADGASTARGDVRLVLEGATAGVVNRALVGSGCDVSALVPERTDLATLFARLVGEHAGEPEATA